MSWLLLLISFHSGLFRYEIHRDYHLAKFKSFHTQPVFGPVLTWWTCGSTRWFDLKGKPLHPCRVCCCMFLRAAVLLWFLSMPLRPSMYLSQQQRQTHKECMSFSSGLKGTPKKRKKKKIVLHTVSKDSYPGNILKFTGNIGIMPMKWLLLNG